LYIPTPKFEKDPHSKKRCRVLSNDEKLGGKSAAGKREMGELIQGIYAQIGCNPNQETPPSSPKINK